LYLQIQQDIELIVQTTFKEQGEAEKEQIKHYKENLKDQDNEDQDNKDANLEGEYLDNLLQ